MMPFSIGTGLERVRVAIGTGLERVRVAGPDLG